MKAKTLFYMLGCTISSVAMLIILGKEYLTAAILFPVMICILDEIVEVNNKLNK